jgi:hypothetical protein
MNEEEDVKKVKFMISNLKIVVNKKNIKAQTLPSSSNFKEKEFVKASLVHNDYKLIEDLDMIVEGIQKSKKVIEGILEQTSFVHKII